MEKSVVFFDIDGTLLTEDTGIVPESSVRAIERLIANGHIPVINTGRPFTHIVPEITELPFRDYVCSCGMYIRMNDRVIQDFRYEKPVCDEMRDLALDCRLDCLFEDAETAYYADCKVVYFDLEDDFNLGDKVSFSSNIYAPEFRFDKFVVFHNEKSDYERFARGAEKYFTLIPRTPLFTELVAKGYSKGNGIKTYLDALPGERRTAYALGDSANDLEMFRAADISILMGSGDMALKSSVDYVTDGINDGGVLHALEHFGLI